MNTKPEELLPCPFCNSEPEVRFDDLDHHFIIACSNCDCTMKYGYQQKMELIKSWNTRPTLSPSTSPVADVIMTHENTKWYRGECCSGYPNCVHKPLLASQPATERKKMDEEEIKNMFRIFQLTDDRNVPNTGIPEWNYDDLAKAIVASFSQAEGDGELIKWIEKSDHQNGCSWSRSTPLYSKCNCGKLGILAKHKKRSGKWDQ